VQRSFLSKRNLAAEAEILSAFERFELGADLERGLDTDSAQHLRRRTRAKQVLSVSEHFSADVEPDAG
jgi:hypothetical protein